MNARQRLLVLVAAAVIAWPLACSKKPQPAAPAPASKTPAVAAPAPASKTPAAKSNVVIEFNDTAAARILLEAESGTIEPPMAKIEKEGASGGVCVWAPEDPEKKKAMKGGSVQLPFAVKAAGKYKIWARVFWRHGCANSLDLILKKKAEPVDQVLRMGSITNSNYEVWQWIQWQREPLDLAAGDFTLIVANRENGAYVDQVLFTQDVESVPQGIEKAAP